MVLEVVAIRRLYGRDHLDHVLGTFGLILFFNELVRLVWGPAGMNLTAAVVARTRRSRSCPASIIRCTGSRSSSWRWRWRGLLYVVIMRTRVGMLIRAGASNREMVGALGINIRVLFTFVFGVGAALAGLAGLMQAAILTAQIGMGENILILAFVVIIIGGIGSIRGAFLAAIFVGLIDTVGRAFLPDMLSLFLSPAARTTAAPALSSMLIYLAMAVVLDRAPRGPVSGECPMMAI